MSRFFEISFLTLLALSLVQGIVVDPYKPIKVRDENHIRITFASCFKFWGTEPGVIFDEIDKQNSDVFAWLGDATYADWFVPGAGHWYGGVNHAEGRFNKTKADPYYANFTSKTQMVGVWDDHDYGTGNGNKNFAHKDEMKEVYFNFIDEPANSPRRREGDGMYGSYYIGQNKRVLLILLDLRYDLDYSGGEDMLGEKQWKWLENELKNTKADFVIIGSSTQFLPDDRLIVEHWYDWSREKFFKMVRDYQVNGVVVLSGDVHLGELMKHPCSNQKVGYPLYEITSSGLSHTVTTFFKRFRDVKDVVFPSTYYAGYPVFVDYNFGTLEIDFEGNEGTLVMSVRDETGKPVITQKVKSSELRSNGKFDTSECITDKVSSWDRIKAHYIGEFRAGHRWIYFTLAFICFVVLLASGLIYSIFLCLRRIYRLIFGSKKSVKQVKPVTNGNKSNKDGKNDKKDKKYKSPAEEKGDKKGKKDKKPKRE